MSIQNRTWIILLFITGVGVLCALPLAHAQLQGVSPSAFPDQISKEAIDVPSLFMEAHSYYTEGTYDQAADRYEKLIQSGIQNGAMYYNLGNSYFKMGMLGKAIVSYRLAELFLPRDEDLKANLSYARQLTKDRIEAKQFLPFIKRFCFWYSSLSLRELLLVFLTAHFLLWCLATAKLFWKNEYATLALIINLSVVVVLGLSLLLKVYSYYSVTDGVVLAKEITVRSGNGFNNTALFQLHDGAELRITKREEDWLQIELTDGKRGWVESRWVGTCRLNSWPPAVHH